MFLYTLKKEKPLLTVIKDKDINDSFGLKSEVYEMFRTILKRYLVMSQNLTSVLMISSRNYNLGMCVSERSERTEFRWRDDGTVKTLKSLTIT